MLYRNALAIGVQCTSPKRERGTPSLTLQASNHMKHTLAAIVERVSYSLTLAGYIGQHFFGNGTFYLQ